MNPTLDHSLAGRRHRDIRLEFADSRWNYKHWDLRWCWFISESAGGRRYCRPIFCPHRLWYYQL